MDTTSLFTAALQLPDPWRVSGVEFRDEEDGRRELHIAIGFAAGSRFPCPEPGCGEAACPVHDARERVWRHLNFFQYKAFIHAGVPRVTCPAHGVHAVPVPWARPGSGFTLLFVLLQCLFDRFGSVFPQCGLMVFPGVVIVSR